jgi:hypothetical protein
LLSFAYNIVYVKLLLYNLKIIKPNFLGVVKMADNETYKEEKMVKEIFNGETSSQEQIYEDLESIQEDPTISEDHKKEAFLNKIREALGIPEITQIIRYDSSPVVWRINTTDSNRYAQFENTEELQSQRRVKARLAEATNRIMTRLDSKTWDKVSQWILNAAEVVGTGEENTEQGGLKGELMAYLEDHVPQDSEQKNNDDINKAIHLRQPVILDDHIHMFLDDFMTWMKTARGNRNAQKRSVSATLKALGCDSVRIKMIKRNGNQTTRNAWKLPGNPEEWKKS